MNMERRSSPRVDAGVPVEFDTADEENQLGIAQNVGADGLLLLSRCEHSPGDLLTLRFRAAGRDGEIVSVSARVVRSEPNDPESLWPTRSAVEFDGEVDIALDALSDPF